MAVTATIERFVLLVAVVVAALASSTVDALAGQPKMDYSGAGVGRLNMDELAGKAGTWNCHYDMVLVERLQKKKKQAVRALLCLLRSCSLTITSCLLVS